MGWDAVELRSISARSWRTNTAKKAGPLDRFLLNQQVHALADLSATTKRMPISRVMRLTV